jgi:hypothetical protein
MPLLEAQASNVAKTIIDMVGSLAVVMTNTTQPVRLVAKYKPGGAGGHVQAGDWRARSAC